ncbi:MAG: FixG Ig-like domain-containing protein [archaeon]
MKLNHFCLIAGIILITLSLSVFANAATCSIPTTWTSCSVSNDSCSRCGSTCSPDVLSCGEEVDSCINGTFFEVSDSSDSYNWGCKNGDDYVCCSINKPINGVCDSEIDSCISGDFVDVSDSTTQFKWSCEGLYGGVSANCVVNDPCGLDMAPYILDIPNQTISYIDLVRIDLWDYVKDYDDFSSELELFFEVIDGESVDCEIVSNRFLECSVIDLGENVFGLTVMDSCGKEDYKEFSINVTNSPPRIFVPNKSVSCVEDLEKFIDLRDYSADENKSELVFELVDQSNTDLMDCVIEEDYYLSCFVNSCVNESSTIIISTEDSFGEVAEATFVMSVRNASPVWESVSPKCISESESNLFDLRDYVSDKEDGSELDFDLNNSLLTGLVCLIEDDYFVSCELSSNKFLTNELSVSATDSFGNTSTKSIFVSGNCTDENRGSISFTSKVYGICLEKCSTYAFPIKVENDSNKRVCFDFDSKSIPYNYLETFVSNNKFCLNSGESSEVTLNVNSCSAQERTYTVKVFDNEINLDLDFEFEVGNCNNFDGFKIEEYDGTICSGEKREYSVLVKNSSSIEKKIYLSAENSFMLPHFNKDYIILQGDESEYVSLKINASSLRVGSSEVVSILGVGEDYHIKKLINFDVVDCSNIKKRTFELSVPSVCFDVERGQKFESQFSIRRNSDGDDCSITKKDFFLNLYGATSELSYNTVSLKKGDSKTIFYSLSVPSDLSAGKNYVTVNAVDGFEWDSFSESKNICLNVLPQSDSSFFVRTQLKDVIWCGSNIFEIEVVNNGDLDENYSLSYIELPTGVSINFSESNFTVKKGESKTIYVSVSTNPNSRIGDNQKIQLKLDGSTQLNTTIYFSIKERTSFDNLQILSATSKISMVGGSSAAFDLVIRNNSQKDLNGVIVSIESLPSQVGYEEILIPLIKSGEVIAVNGLIKAGDVNGVYDPVFVVASNEFLNKKSFVLSISKNEGFFSGMFTGLFSFGLNPISFNELNFGGIFGLVILAIILIVLVWLITLGVLIVSKPVSKEAWME